MRFIIGICLGLALGLAVGGHDDFGIFHKSARLAASQDARQLSHQAVQAAQLATKRVIAAANAKVNEEK